jgi:hypothetical protein
VADLVHETLERNDYVVCSVVRGFQAIIYEGKIVCSVWHHSYNTIISFS